MKKHKISIIKEKVNLNYIYNYLIQLISYKFLNYPTNTDF